ncbi:MAG: MarR family transcriptional regulator [Actinoplanes sp.]
MDERDELVQLLRAYSVEATQLGDAFAHVNGLHPTDLHALIAVMQASRRGDPLTPGRLGEALELSSGATTAVIDRLERAGHLKRVRESPDRRVVHLLHDAPAMELASSFFRPLVARSHAVMDEFTPEELEVILRFMRGITAAVTAHHREVRGL